MYSFDGQFRRRPEQLLAGNSVTTDRHQLLQHVQHQRQLRKQLQLQQQSACRVQAFVRGCVARARLRRDLRAEFDARLMNAAGVWSLADVRRLALLMWRVYQPQCQADVTRLTALIQVLLRQPCLRCQLMQDYQLCYGRLLVIAVWCLKCDSYMALPLRLLEESLTRKETSDNCVTHVHLSCLAKNMYWHHLRQLLERRVPKLHSDVSAPPVPLAATVINLIVGPLQSCSTISSTTTTSPTNLLHSMFETFVTQFFAAPISSQLRHFVLPALCESPGRFPLSDFLLVLSGSGGGSSGTSGGAYRLLTEPLMFVLLRVAGGENSTHITLSPADTSALLQSLGSCCSNWHSIIDWSTRRGGPVDTDDSSDEGDGQDVGDPTTGTSHTLDSDTVSLLNCSWFVRVVLETVGKVSGDDGVLTSVCWLCYRLLHSGRLALHRHRLLYSLAFSRHFLVRVWPLLQTLCVSATSPVQVAPVLATFCALLGHHLPTVRDEELADSAVFTCNQLVTISAQLRDVFLDLLLLAYPALHSSAFSVAYTSLLQHRARCPPGREGGSDWPLLLRLVGALLWQIQSRDCRLHFCPAQHWCERQQPLPADRMVELARLMLQQQEQPQGEDDLHLTADSRLYPCSSRSRSEPGSGWARDTRALILLRHLPFVFSFEQRVQLFHELVRRDRAASQSELDHFMTSGLGSNIQLTVRRDFLYEDSFDKLSPDNEPSLKKRLRVAMINAKGLDEAGVDGGGIFREFLSELLKTAFNPNRGFFCVTNINQLYPNPHVDMLFDNSDAHYFFIGRMLAKALYEQLLVELPLAAFFLVKLLGRRLDSVDVHYLHTLDPQLYRSLMYLMTSDSTTTANVQDLGLDFSVSVAGLGTTRQHELKPGGASVPVTASNCVEYVHLMADFKLNVEIRRQCAALRRGLANVLPLDWLQMFDHAELQTLIAGAPVAIDVDDLRCHTRYSGTFNAEHPVVLSFWRVVHSLEERQKSLLLRFVTSCSRPPLLGFGELQPPFCVQSTGEHDRLPSASTCMHLLKLPEYESDQLLREKLLYAVEAEAGFELS